MSDVKENSFVGIAAMPQPDGTIKAVEVSVFAEPLRGTAEGHYPWDLMPNSSMTNATVAQQVVKQEGNTLTLKYKDGEKPSSCPPTFRWSIWCPAAAPISSRVKRCSSRKQQKAQTAF